jgi:hypothetical protein
MEWHNVSEQALRRVMIGWTLRFRMQRASGSRFMVTILMVIDR